MDKEQSTKKKKKKEQSTIGLLNRWQWSSIFKIKIKNDLQLGILKSSNLSVNYRNKLDIF